MAAISKKVEPTKRNVASVVSWFYGPLGIVTPVTTRFKVFIQELCEVVGPTAYWRHTAEVANPHE